jgi:hypothetical protein
MESKSSEFPLFRPRLRTLLIAVAVAGVVFTVMVREMRFRAQLQQERASAEANFQKAQAAVNQYFSQVTEQSAVPGPQSDELRREFLEQSLKFYQRMESKAASPADTAKIRDRLQRIETELGRGVHGNDGPRTD